MGPDGAHRKFTVEDDASASRAKSRSRIGRSGRGYYPDSTLAFDAYALSVGAYN